MRATLRVRRRSRPRKDRRTISADGKLTDRQKLTHVVQYRHLESPILYLRKRHIRDALRIMSRFKGTSQEEVGIQYARYSRKNLLRSNLLDCLESYWETLKIEGIFAMPSRQVFTWTLEGSLEQVRRLHHLLILCYLDAEDDLH